MLGYPQFRKPPNVGSSDPALESFTRLLCSDGTWCQATPTFPTTTGIMLKQQARGSSPTNFFEQKKLGWFSNVFKQWRVLPSKDIISGMPIRIYKIYKKIDHSMNNLPVLAHAGTLILRWRDAYLYRHQFGGILLGIWPVKDGYREGNPRTWMEVSIGSHL